MKHSLTNSISILAIIALGHVSSAQITAIIPDADTVRVEGYAAPPTLQWTVAQSANAIDTVKLLPTHRTIIYTFDSYGMPIIWQQISICIADTFSQFTYQLSMLDRHDMPLPIWTVPPPDTDFACPAAPSLKLLVFQNSTVVDSIVQILVGDIFLSVEPSVNIPSFALNQNYPNPFNPSTTISFSLHSKQRITLQIFDLAGRLVASLLDDDLDPGPHSIRWAPNNIPTGAYFYRLVGDNYAVTRKLQLLR